MKQFKASISNEEVSVLEAIQFDGKIVVVETIDAARQACADLAQATIIGFDTETRPSFKAGVTNRVSLLQLYGRGTCYLFRLNRIPLLKEITALLHDGQILKIGAAVQNDIVGLCALRHFTANGFIDLQSMVGNYGIEDKSLRKISGIVLGKKVSKAQRLSNWEAKLLTPQQTMYAATDAWVCAEIYRALLE